MAEQLHDAGPRSDYVSTALADLRHLPHYVESMVNAGPAGDEAGAGQHDGDAAHMRKVVGSIHGI